MAAPATPVSIVNRALASFGSTPITTLSDAAPPAPACALVYQNVVDELLGGYEWSFCKDVVALTPLALPLSADGFLDTGWRYAFALPTNTLRPPTKYLRDPRRESAPITRFSVQAQRIYCDEPALWAEVIQRADETEWPPYFVAAAVACCAAELIMPISGNAGVADKLSAKAYGTPGEARRGGMVGEAQRLDAQNKGNRQINTEGLLGLWRNG